MKLKNFLVVVLTVFFLTGTLLSAEEDKDSFLEKAYFGTLYMGSITKDYYLFQNNLFPLAAVKAKFPVMSGHIYSRLIYNFEETGAHLWWMKKFSSLEFNLGYFPRPVALINRPEPVSSAGNFEPPCKSVIPGPAFGALGRFTSENVGTDLMFGLYKTNKNSVEFNFGFQQNINWSIFQKVGISGYRSSKTNDDGKYVEGLVLNAEVQKVSLMFFGGRDTDSIKTYSGFSHLALNDNTGIYACLVHKQNSWQKAEVGIFKTFSEKIGGVEVDYLLGLAYGYSETEPNYINFYLQIWLDK